MLEALVDAVTRAGHSPVILDSRIVIVPAWGRVVGLFPDGRRTARRRRAQERGSGKLPADAGRRRNLRDRVAGLDLLPSCGHGGRPDPAGRVLVVRTFPVTPAERCSDVPGTLPADDPRAAGYVQQLYVDDGALGGFGELEHHSEYLSPDNGYRVTDVCETFAYCGPADAVAAVKERWLASARSKA